MLGERCEQRPGILLDRTPRLDRPQPVALVKAKGYQAAVEAMAVVARTAGRVQQFGPAQDMAQQTLVTEHAPLMS
jgi:hypothetical protein